MDTILRSLRQRSVRREGGMALIYVMVMAPVMMFISTGIVLTIAADSSGISHLQAVKAYAIAEGGLHYALAKLQAAGAASYGSGGPETVTITDGATTIGTATVTVSCLEGVLQPPNCTGPYLAYRRIRSDGQLPVGGALRTLHATVQGTGGGIGMAACAGDKITLTQSTTVYGDVGSNNMIDLQGTSPNQSRVRKTPPLPYTNDGSYTGSARSTGAINCSVTPCSQHVEGAVTPSIGSPVCPTVALPAFSPGTTGLTVSSGTTHTLDTTQKYANISVSAGPGGFGVGPCPGGFTTLIIPTGAAGTTTVVEANKLTLGQCSRLVISGAGNVELRLKGADAMGVARIEGLEAAIHSRVGVLPTDTAAVPAPIPSGRLMIISPSTSGASSTGASAIDFDGAAIVSAMLAAPNGGIVYEPTGATSSKWYGGLAARHIHLGTGVSHVYDPTVAIPLWGPPTSFGKLRGWKDQ